MQNKNTEIERKDNLKWQNHQTKGSNMHEAGKDSDCENKA